MNTDEWGMFTLLNRSLFLAFSCSVDLRLVLVTTSVACTCVRVRVCVNCVCVCVIIIIISIGLCADMFIRTVCNLKYIYQFCSVCV